MNDCGSSFLAVSKHSHSDYHHASRSPIHPHSTNQMFGVGATMERGHLLPHFVKMGNGHFEDSGPFDSEIQ